MDQDAWIASYLRISNDPLNLQAGVGRQRKDNKAIASTRWPEREVREYVDNDISASKYTKKKRPAFRQLCEDIAAGKVYAAVGWNFDRMFRKPSELEAFIELCDRVRFQRAVTAQGDVDLTTDDGQLHARIMVAVAAKSSADTSRRVKRQLQDRADNGQHRGGRVVFGYRMVDGEPVPVAKHVKLVRAAAKQALDGVPLRAIAKGLPAGAPHTGAGVRKMLLSPTLIGRTTTGKRGGWEPILSDVQQAELRSMLCSPARRHQAPSGERVWWLSGLVVCGLCDMKLRVVSNHSTHKPGHNYQCHQAIAGKACGKVAIRADLLHWHVETQLFEVVDATEPAPRADMVPAPSDVEDRLSILAVKYATGEISLGEWTAARDSLIPAVPLPSVSVQPVPDLATRWERMTPNERHQHASRVIGQVRVYPRVHGGPKWQPDRVAVCWSR